jgi:hypothetical protein
VGVIGVWSKLPVVSHPIIQVDMADLAAVQRAVDAIDNIGLVWIETPSNALLKITSVTDVCRIAKQVSLDVTVFRETVVVVCLPCSPRVTQSIRKHEPWRSYAIMPL